MGELLSYRGADPFSYLTCAGCSYPLLSLRSFPAVVPSTRESVGVRLSAGRLSGTCIPRYGTTSKYNLLCSDGNGFHRRNRGRRDRDVIFSSFIGTLPQRIVKEKNFALASIHGSSNSFCRFVDDPLILRFRFGFSSLILKRKSFTSKIYNRGVTPRPPECQRNENAQSLWQSLDSGTCFENLQSEFRLASHLHSSLFCSRTGHGHFSSRSHLNLLYGNHVQKIRVDVHANPQSWWKRYLFQRLDVNDYESDEENGETEDDDEDDVDDENNGDDDDDGDDDEELGDENVGRLRDIKFGKLGKLQEDESEDDIDSMLSNDRKYFAWKERRKTLDEIREYQETGVDPDSRDWEDWLEDSYGDYSQYAGGKDGGWYTSQSDWEKGGLPREPPTKPERGMSRTFKEMLFRVFEPREEVLDDLTFEANVFRFTTKATAQFVVALILVPWFIDFLVHDFLVVPFLKRWVEEVPLAAKILDVRTSQKKQMIEKLKLERQRVRFEAEIGQAPPLSDEELNEHIHEEALELREYYRDENRQTFANIWSDAVAGLTLWLLLLFNPQRVSIMRMTGDRLFTNVSDTGKAFIIILCTDIFLGYHSESGWETVIDILLDHYGLEASQASIYIFVAIVPVTIDACFKLWVFRYLSRLSPSAAATFREMKRH